MGVFFYPQTGNQLSQERHNRFRWIFFSILCIKGWCFQKSKFWCVATEAWPWNSRSRTFSKQFHITVPISRSWVSYRYDFWANMHVILFMELEWTKIHTVVFKRDPVRQGHVTLSVTFPNSGSRDARAMIFFLFHRFLGSRMSNTYESTL